ncbi:hypothetical protein ASE40_05450 [Flavobacterium sp. Root935]|nr:hypothetical protein ASE40_05450 [Flavobacterium sp. Root935]
MKLSHEIINGIYIFMAIGLFFILLEIIDLSHLFYLRLLNIFFIIYGVNRTLNMNRREGNNNFMFNAVSSMQTAFTGVVLSIAALVIYSYAKGGDGYVISLSQAFMFGGDPSVPAYCLSLLFEGSASCIIVTLILMLYGNNKYKAD